MTADALTAIGLSYIGATVAWALRVERKVAKVDMLHETLQRVEDKLDRLIESRTPNGR